MKRLSLLLAAIVVLMTVGCSLLPSRRAQEFPAITITEGIGKVNFTVKQPTWLPFTPTSKWAHAGTVAGPNMPMIELNYSNGNDYVVLTEFRNATNPLSSDRYQITEVKLEQGTSAKFMDNGAVKMLTWVDAGVFYQIAAGGKDTKSGAFTQQDLIKVASSIR